MRLSAGFLCSLLLVAPAALAGPVVEFPEDRILTIEDMESVAALRDGRAEALIDDMIFDIESLRNVDAATRLWPNGVLVYEFEPGLSQSKQNIFRRSCEIWASIANVRCQPRNSESAFALVRSSSENSAHVGMTGKEQQINILNWDNQYIIAHELGHAFGFIHEHQRMDRDARVTIHWENIKPKYLFAFYKIPSINYTIYDYESVMHYSRTAFSNNGKVTITPVYPAWAGQMGQRDHLSLRDHIDFKLAYGEHSTNHTVRVKDMRDAHYANAKAYLYNTENSGYEINVVEGPAAEEDLSIDACQTVILEPIIYHQFMRPGSKVAVGTTVDVKTFARKYVAFDYSSGECK